MRLLDQPEIREIRSEILRLRAVLSRVEMLLQQWVDECDDHNRGVDALDCARDLEAALRCPL